jgi:polyhydroxyalkanoate synthesis regulator phasin
MLELIKKGLLAGLGAAVVTKEKVQEATRLLVQEGKISTEEAEKVAEELIKSGEQQWQDINAKIAETFKKWSENVDFVRNREFQELKSRLEALEQRVSVLEGPREQEEEEPAPPLQ